MISLSLLTDIIRVVAYLQQQVVMVHSNQAQVSDLLQMMTRVVDSLKSLEELPEQASFIEHLRALYGLFDRTKLFIDNLSRKPKPMQFLSARYNQAEIEEIKKELLLLIPLLNMGLTAKELIDQEKDRLSREADHQALLAQQKEQFEQLQQQQHEARLENRELADILRRQLFSMDNRLMADRATDFKTIAFYELLFVEKLDESIDSVYRGHWQETPVTIERITSTDFRRTLRQLKDLRHEHVAQFYGACLEADQQCLVTGPIEKHLGQVSDLSATDRLMVACALAEGLAYLHKKNLAHGAIDFHHVGMNRYGQVRWLLGGWSTAEVHTKANDIHHFGLILEKLMLLGRGSSETVQYTSGFRELVSACMADHKPDAITIVQRLSLLTKHDMDRSSSPTGEMLYAEGIQAQEEKDEKRAYELFKRASEKDFAKAFTSVGLFKLEGRGGQRINKLGAVVYLKKGAERGHGRAMFNLGRVYEKGDTSEGVQDKQAALEWYQKALDAEPNNPRYQAKVNALR